MGGTDVQPTAARASHAVFTGLDKNPLNYRTAKTRTVADETLSTTAKNGRQRERRKEIWRMAEAATRYWRVRLDFDDAVGFAQRMEIPEGSYHPVVESNDRYATVELWRKALVKQLLTPAPDTASVKWKQTVLAGRSLRHTDVKPERLKHIIDEDLAFLAAHPVRQSNRSARAKDDGGAA